MTEEEIARLQEEEVKKMVSFWQKGNSNHLDVELVDGNVYGVGEVDDANEIGNKLVCKSIRRSKRIKKSTNIKKLMK